MLIIASELSAEVGRRSAWNALERPAHPSRKTVCSCLGALDSMPFLSNDAREVIHLYSCFGPFPFSCLFLMSRRRRRNKAGWSTMGICPACGMREIFFSGALML